MSEELCLGAPVELSPGPARARPTRVRDALGFALDLPRRDLLLASLLACVPVFGWLVLAGWTAELVRRVHVKNPEPLPPLRLSDAWSHARLGGRSFAIQLVAMIVLVSVVLALFAVANAGALLAWLVASGSFVPLAVLALGGAGALTLGALGALFVDGALLRAELGESLSRALSGAFAEARGARLRTLRVYAAFAPLAFGIVLLGSALCFVGMLPALVIVQVAAARLRAELSCERARRLGRALPAPAPRLLPSERRALPRLPAALSILMCGLSLAACNKSSATTRDPEPAPAKAAATGSPSSAPVASAPPVAPPPAKPSPPVVIRAGGERAVRGTSGLVTSVEEHATRAGVRVLEQGGNAVDAAVAVGYALAVTHPSAGNIGGGGFMLVRMKGGPTVAIDFRETAPRALGKEAFDRMIDAGAVGPAAVGVPGTPAGLELAHGRFGKLPRKQVLAPAIELAQRGHRLGTRQGQTIGWAWPVLKKDPAARAIFGDGDRPKQPGAWLRQPDLARVLQRIADQGSLGFYAGQTAEAIVRALKPGKLMTLEDLSSYRAKLREPLVTSYRGLSVEVMPPPSAGGVAVVQTLGILERHEAWKLEAGSAADLHLFIEASRRAHAEKRFAVLDPDALSADALVKRRQHWLDVDGLIARTPAIDATKATPSADVHPLYAAAMRELENTTHYSVVDRDGNVVSCTVTLSHGFGARIVAGGTGIVLNNSVAAFGTAGDNLPVGGRRTTSSMAPTLVLRDGQVVLVLGSPGGDTIPSTVTQVLRNVVDHGMTIDRAIDAPRIHHGFVPDLVRYERKRPPSKAVRDALDQLGHRFSDKRIPIGDANDILIESGIAYGYADPREGGLALAAKP